MRKHMPSSVVWGYLLLGGILVGCGDAGPIPSGRQCPTIHDAVGAGNMKDIKSYIAEDVSLVESRDSQGELPIHHAIKYGQMAALTFIIQNGANVNGQASPSGDASLHYAVMFGNEESIRLLIASGADPLVVNDLGETPLDCARQHTYSNVDRIIHILQKAEEGLNKPEAGDGK